MSGHAAAPLPYRSQAVAVAMIFSAIGHTATQYREAVHRYHVFASLRPWWISQQYLAPKDRPVDLVRTLALLLTASGLGLGLMLLASRRAP
jgi:hypothetical protein